MKATMIAALCLVLPVSAFAADETPVSISLERTVCFGTCPSYIVTLLADGSVTFEGREHVKTKGVATKKIDASKLIPIFKKLEEIHFWELEDSYRTKKNADGSITSISDLPTKNVTVKTATKTKKVEDYFGTPAGMNELELLIDEVAGVNEWVGDPKDRKPATVPAKP